jgi:raffinose/stachyose/melibiose transport system substrate-binding protein
MGRSTPKKMVAAAAAVLVAVALGACGSTGPSRPGGPGGTLAWAVQGGAAKVYADSVERFNQAHPDQRIELQTFQNDPYKQKLRVAVGAGNPPDLFFGWGGGVLSSYAKSGNVHDLSPEMSQDPAWSNRFFPNVMQSVTFDGKVYGVPIRGVQPVVFFLNKDAFAKAGVQPPKTWQDLLDAIGRFKAAGLTPISLGGASRWTYLMWEEYLVDRLGGPQVIRDVLAGKPGAWSNPAVIQANTMIQQLVDAGAFGSGFASVSYDTGQQSALVYTGKAAMELMGTWDFSSILQSQPAFISSGKLGWSTFPSVPGGAGNPDDVVGNSSNFYSVSEKSPHQRTAIDYLRTTVMDDKYVDALIKVGDVPPVRGIESKLAGADHGDYLQFVYQLSQNAPNFQLSWDQALQPDQAETLLTNLEQLFLKKITPEQFSAAMNGTLK